METRKKKLISGSNLIVTAGLAAGVTAALVQILFGVGPPNAPVAYGVCVACHARDLVSWLVNTVGHTSLGYATVAIGAPVLTVVGTLIGAFVAAVRNQEFKLKTARNPLVSFVCGFAVMLSALTLGACPLRTILRIAYGDAIAVIGFSAIALGVLLSASLIKVTARRAIDKDDLNGSN